jgi:hypothetical protein
MPHPHGNHTPEHIGSIRFSPPGAATLGSRAALPALPEGEILLDLLFQASDYPFSRHCRYARLDTGARRRTFANMVFSADPPGERVGPWPGWRGIPDMPGAVLHRGELRAEVRFQFWGEEERSGHLRGVCILPEGPEGWITVDSGHQALIPHSAEIYRTTRPRPAPLGVELRPELHKTHPRLLLCPADLPALRAAKSRSQAWAEICRLLPEWDLPAELTPESKTLRGPERFRTEDKVLIGALLALIDPTAENLQRALRAFREYLSETAAPDYEPLQIDTQSGETLFILAVGYDWLCEHLTPTEQVRAREWLFAVAERCWSFLGYRRRDYAQAHYLGCALGVLAFAFLFWEEHPRAREWVQYFAGVLDVVCGMLPEDGFYPHGINLWIYEYGFLLRWLELYRVCAGRDLWERSDHWRNASRFRASVTSPDGTLALTFGDPQYRVSGDAWMHFLIGSRTGDAHASALGDFLSGVSHEGVDFRATPPRRRVYEFLYSAPARNHAPAESLPCEIFPDGGQISIRTPDVLFCFRGGPPLGWSRYRTGEFGAYGHADPAHGAFVLLYRGCPVVCGPGPVYRRETAHHSCPTVDGIGQIGNSCVWLPDFYPPSALPPPPEVMVRGSCVALSARLEQAYLPSSGIQAADRSLFVDPERCIVGSDRITCDRTRAIMWHLSSRYPIAAQPGERTFRLGPPDGPGVEFAVLSPTPPRWHAAPAPVVPGYTSDGEPLYTLTIVYETSRLEVLWCLSLGDYPVSDYACSGDVDWHLKAKDGWTVRRHGIWVYPEDFDAHQD